MGPGIAKETGMKTRIRAKYIPLMATAAVLIALYAVGSLRYRNFFSLRVVVDLFGDNAFLGVAAVGATFVILSGGIDLSVGSVVAFTSIFIARLVTHHHVPPLIAIALALLIGGIALPGAFLAKAFVERMPVHVHTVILDAAVLTGGLVMISAALRQIL